MKLLLILITLCLSSQNANAARWFSSPEVPNLTCADGIDNDADGTYDAADADCAAASPFSANGNGYRADAKDAIVSGFTTAADATSSSGTYLKKSDQASPYWLGEFALHGNFTNATYYAWIRYRCSETACPIWLSTSPIKGNPNNATQAMILPQAATWTWAQILYTGSNANFRAGTNGGGVRTFALNGNGAIFGKSASGLEIDCHDLDPDADHTPDCLATGGAGPTANYEILELGSEDAPTSCASAAFTNANVMTFQGYDNTTSLGTVTAKMLWDNTTTDRIYLCVSTTDTDDEIVAVANDSFSTSEDNIDFRWRADQSQTFDTDTYMVVGNLQPIYADADWSGVDNARTFATNLNTTVAKTVTASTSWDIFLAFDAGSDIATDTLGICNLAIRDKDSGVGVAIKHFFGTTINAMLDASEFGICKFSATTVPASGGGGDVTAPLVSSCTAENVTANSFTAQCTSDEAGTATLKRDTDNDSAVDGADMVTVAGGSVGATTFTVAVSGLSASQLYEWKMEVQDAAGNVGTGAIVDTTTSAATATLYVSSTGSGTTCSSGSPCLPASVWASTVPGSIIEFAAGTYQGANSMIVPSCTGCGSINGTAANPITVRCATDGACNIDGENARRPISLTNNDYFIITGFNAYSSNGDVVSLGTGADNNKIQRVCAWDTAVGDNAMVFNVNSNTGNLLEDVCGFGKGRKIFGINGTTNLTIRRAWGVWQQNTITGPKITFTNDYDSSGAVYENLIGSWNSQMGATAVNQPIGIFGTDQNSPAGECNNNHYYASLAYLRSTDVAVSFEGMARSNNDSDCAKFQDIITYIEPSTHTNIKPASLINISGATATQRFYTNATEIGGTTASTVGSQWTTTNRKTYASIAAMDADSANPFQTSSGNGGRMCFRTEAGVLTSTKLWPWPMDERIGAAWDIRNGAGSALADFGSLTAPITTQMETIFGTIPAGCKTN